MKRAITDGIIAVAVGAVIYILILAALYGSDKQYCAGYGYKNQITPTFEGYCIREIESGITEIVPIEYMRLMKHNPNNGKPGWRNEP